MAFEAATGMPHDFVVILAAPFTVLRAIRWLLWSRTQIAIVVTGCVVAGCSALGPEQRIVGEIDDDAVRLAQQSGPQSVRLELTNVGQDPCALVVVTTPSPPDDLPIADGRVALDFGSDPNGAYPMQAGVEINGERVGRGEPADDELEEFEAAHAVVQPGDIARVQLALIGTPERDERVIICNDPGDYQAGRYAVLLFER